MLERSINTVTSTHEEPFWLLMLFLHEASDRSWSVIERSRHACMRPCVERDELDGDIRELRDLLQAFELCPHDLPSADDPVEY
ncbi:hypothetical protein GCM10029978_034960 [Actinoallomurus acanthiterrae]